MIFSTFLAQSELLLENEKDKDELLLIVNTDEIHAETNSQITEV